MSNCGCCNAGGAPLEFWAAARLPGNLAVDLVFFFAIAVFISMLAHALLAFDATVRRLAWMGALLTCVYMAALALGGMRLTWQSAWVSETSTLAGYLMIFAIIATCGDTGPKWLIWQVAVFAVFALIMALTNEQFRQGEGELVALFGPPWQQAMYYIYYALGGVFALARCWSANGVGQAASRTRRRTGC